MRQRHYDLSLAKGCQDCGWMLQHPEYCRWEQDSKAFLLLTGKVGSGKSILMYTCVDSNVKEKKNILQFYFDASRTQESDLNTTAVGFFRSLLHQLLQDRRPPHDFMQNFRDTKQKVPRQAWNWSCGELQSACEAVLRQKQRSTSPTYLFIDALDECKPNDADKILQFLHNVVPQASTAGTLLKICISRRPHCSIISLLRDAPYEIEVGNNNQKGLIAFVNSELGSLFDPEDRRELGPLITERASGVFLWVKVIFDKYRLEGERHNRAWFKRKLEESPVQLDLLYRELLVGCDPSQRSDACWLFQLVLFAKRPLSWEEIRHVYAFRSSWSHDGDSIDVWEESSDHRLSSMKKAKDLILQISCGLLEIRSEGLDDSGIFVVQPIHHSVREYLVRVGLSELDPNIVRSRAREYGAREYGHLELFKTCMRILHADSMAEKTKFPTPFRHYTCSWWMAHARDCDLLIQRDISVVPKFLLRCDQDRQKLMNMITSYKRELLKRDWKRHGALRNEDSIFVLMAAEGCNTLLRHHAKDCECLEPNLNRCRPVDRALYHAAEFNLFDTLCHLKEHHGADVDSAHMKQNRTALYIAAYRGWDKIVERLLLMGANPYQKGGEYGSALAAATACGHDTIVATLTRATEQLRASENDSEPAAKMDSIWWLMPSGFRELGRNFHQQRSILPPLIKDSAVRLISKTATSARNILEPARFGQHDRYMRLPQEESSIRRVSPVE